MNSSRIATLLQPSPSETFEAGYQHAIDDLLDSMVLIFEDFLRDERADNPSSQLEQRKLLYRFAEHLESRVRRLPSQAEGDH